MPAQSFDLKIEPLPPSALRPYTRNARTHSRKQIREIARSIERFGFTNPVLVDDGGEIIAGHGRVEAAKLLNMPTVPVLRLSHLSTAERQAYVIADNRLAEKAGWDREILAIELQSLIDLSFEVELTGFETADIDQEEPRPLLATARRGLGTIDNQSARIVDMLIVNLS